MDKFPSKITKNFTGKITEEFVNNFRGNNHNIGICIISQYIFLT